MVASTPPAPYQLQNLQQLSQNDSYYHRQFKHSDIRDRAIKQAAERLGSQSGLAAQSRAIDAQLQKHAAKLESIFNFRLVMYRNNVLPPVLEKAQNTVHIGAAGQQLRIGGKVYNIIRQVRFVSTSPTWRTYLWMDFSEPQMPDKVLLPKNDKERVIWQHAVTEGWQQGIKQAVTIYHVNLHHLVRDFNGMLLYKSLLLKGMITPYHVTKANYGITGNKHHMVIDDQTWTLSQQPSLQLHSKFWEPVVRSPQESS